MNTFKGLVIGACLVVGACACACASAVGESAGALTSPVGPFSIAPLGVFGCAGEYTVDTLEELCAGRDVTAYMVSDQFVLLCNTPAENRMVQFDPNNQTGVFSVAGRGLACVASIQ